MNYLGREYDKKGILRPWWNDAVIERFKNQTSCMEAQYSKYTINSDQVRHFISSIVTRYIR